MNLPINHTITTDVQMETPVLEFMDTPSFNAINNNKDLCFCISSMIKHFSFLYSVQVDINKGQSFCSTYGNGSTEASDESCSGKL
jgi:hypothetical protein